MSRFRILLVFILTAGLMSMYGTEQAEVAPELKDAALRDAACVKAADTQTASGKPGDTPTLTTLPIRSAGREVGEIVGVQGACHCQSANCDQLVYLRTGEGFRLALHEKYASLHPMKIVKRGMPSLTGQFELSAAKMETTVYDWDGKDYRPSLCATVIKHGKVPSITQHACKAPAQ